MMKKIDQPNISINDVCDSLLELKYKDRVIEKSQRYKEFLDKLEFLLNDEKLMDNLDKGFKDHMIKMYSQRFSHSSYPSYTFYKKIRNSQPICPYCNFPSHSIRQLDHYLPKSVFPSLAITPANLVPICSDCNVAKKNYYSVEKHEMLIHPYFDEFISESFDFIKCKVIENENIGFIFYIKQLESWDNCTYNRVKLHFEKLNLNDLYRTNFEADFVVFCYELKDVYSEIGEEGVIKHINRHMNSYKKSNRCPWLYAGYEAIISSEWFIKVYLKTIVS